MASDATRKFRRQQRLKRRIKEFITIICLLGVMVGYTFVGAFLFRSIEGKHEEESKVDFLNTKKRLLDELWLHNMLQGKPHHKVHYGNWSRMVDRLLVYYAEDVISAGSEGLDVQDVTENEMESRETWNMVDSLFFAGTVYTTIGYGNFAPVTDEGKIAVMIYGSIGIPLCLILLAHIGNAIAKWIKTFVRDFKSQLYGGRRAGKLSEFWPPEDELSSLSGWSSLIVLLSMCAVYLFAGAAMYRMWEEDWSYLDAVYFIFVSTSTIGFGDVLPSDSRWFLFSSLYIFIGLSLVSTGFTILQDIMEVQLSSYQDGLNHVLGIHKERGVETNPNQPERNNNNMMSLSTSSRTADTKLINREDNTYTFEATIVLD